MTNKTAYSLDGKAKKKILNY